MHARDSAPLKRSPAQFVPSPAKRSERPHYSQIDACLSMEFDVLGQFARCTQRLAGAAGDAPASRRVLARLSYVRIGKCARIRATRHGGLYSRRVEWSFQSIRAIAGWARQTPAADSRLGHPLPYRGSVAAFAVPNGICGRMERYASPADTSRSRSDCYGKGRTHV